MKRNFDLIRDILLKIEELPNIEDYLITEEDLPDYSFNDVTYHIMIMMNSGLIHGVCEQVNRTDGGNNLRGRKKCYGVYLTWDGCELLDQIRDRATWRKIKQALLDSAIPITLGAVQSMAVSFVTSKIGKLS